MRLGRGMAWEGDGMGLQKGQKAHEGSGPRDYRERALSSPGIRAWGEEQV